MLSCFFDGKYSLESSFRQAAPGVGNKRPFRLLRRWLREGSPTEEGGCSVGAVRAFVNGNGWFVRHSGECRNPGGREWKKSRNAAIRCGWRDSPRSRVLSSALDSGIRRNDDRKCTTENYSPFLIRNLESRRRGVYGIPFNKQGVSGALSATTAHPR